MKNKIYLGLFIIALNFISISAYAELPVILRINCSGYKETTAVLGVQSTRPPEASNFMLTINTLNGNFAVEGYTLIGPTLDLKSTSLKFKMNEENFTFSHQYSNEIKDPYDYTKLSKSQLQTNIKVNRYSGTTTINEILIVDGSRPIFQTMQGTYDCNQVKDKKF